MMTMMAGGLDLLRSRDPIIVDCRRHNRGSLNDFGDSSAAGSLGAARLSPLEAPFLRRKVLSDPTLAMGRAGVRRNVSAGTSIKSLAFGV